MWERSTVYSLVAVAVVQAWAMLPHLTGSGLVMVLARTTGLVAAIAFLTVLKASMMVVLVQVLAVAVLVRQEVLALVAEQAMAVLAKIIRRSGAKPQQLPTTQVVAVLEQAQHEQAALAVAVLAAEHLWVEQ